MTPTVTLNVGGKVFQTTDGTLNSYPDTYLPQLVAEARGSSKDKPVELFLDRNPKIVPSILDFYRTGELHLSRNLCTAVVERELKFWGIPVNLICQRCWKDFDSDQNHVKMTQEIDQLLDEPFKDEDKTRVSFGTRMWLTMEYADYSTAAKLWNLFYFSVVLFSLLIFALSTSSPFRELRTDMDKGFPSKNATSRLDVQSFNTQEIMMFTRPFEWVTYSEDFAHGFFFFELLVRLIVCPRKAEFFKHFKNCLDMFLLVHYMLLRLLDEYMMHRMGEGTSELAMDVIVAFQALTVLRSLRILYFAKDLDAMKVIWLSAKASVKELLMLVVCVMSFVTLFGALIFVIETMSDSFIFTSIPQGAWWAIITMTTIGYGDKYPHSTAGKIVGGVCALSGVIVLALPVAVLASRFTDYHSNLSSQQQTRAREIFLRRNPRFRWEDPNCLFDVYQEEEKENGIRGQRESEEFKVKGRGRSGRITSPLNSKIYPKY